MVIFKKPRSIMAEVVFFNYVSRASVCSAGVNAFFEIVQNPRVEHALGAPVQTHSKLTRNKLIVMRQHRVEGITLSRGEPLLLLSNRLEASTADYVAMGKSLVNPSLFMVVWPVIRAPEGVLQSVLTSRHVSSTPLLQ